MTKLESILCNKDINNDSARIWLNHDEDGHEVDCGLISNLRTDIDLSELIGWTVVVTADYQPKRACFYLKEEVGEVLEDGIMLYDADDTEE